MRTENRALNTCAEALKSLNHDATFLRVAYIEKNEDVAAILAWRRALEPTQACHMHFTVSHTHSPHHPLTTQRVDKQMGRLSLAP